MAVQVTLTESTSTSPSSGPPVLAPCLLSSISAFPLRKALKTWTQMCQLFLLHADRSVPSYWEQKADWLGRGRSTSRAPGTPQLIWLEAGAQTPHFHSFRRARDRWAHYHAYAKQKDLWKLVFVCLFFSIGRSGGDNFPFCCYHLKKNNTWKLTPLPFWILSFSLWKESPMPQQAVSSGGLVMAAVCSGASLQSHPILWPSKASWGRDRDRVGHSWTTTGHMFSHAASGWAGGKDSSLGPRASLSPGCVWGSPRARLGTFTPGFSELSSSRWRS